MSQYVCRVGDRNSGGGSVINGINSVLVNGLPIAVVSGSNITPHMSGGGAPATPTPATVPSTPAKTNLYSPFSPVQNIFNNTPVNLFGTPAQNPFPNVYDAYTGRLIPPPPSYNPPPPPIPPPPPAPPLHPMGTIIQGDRTVLAGNNPTAYITSSCSCGHKMIAGSNNVTVGAK